MSGPSKVIVLDPDVRAGRQVQLGFEREGVPTAVIAAGAAGPAEPADPALLELPGDDVGLAVVGGVDGQGLELVRRTRALLDSRKIDVPIVFAGRGVERRNAEAAGADEVVQQPAYLRDVVTIGRLLRGQPSSQRGRLVGTLAEITGVFTLVRALATMGRSATLTLARGLRRGEIRFYHGEVTSAQVGMIHGQAALHQLLLWTDARFDFHHEDIVRRQQIPLTHEELFADAERFLESVRDASGGLSPAMVLDQDIPRVQALRRQIPPEVYGVLRMFDGHRVLSDVLEDSAYRVFETLRVAQRAVEVGLLRVVDKRPARATWRAILAIEEWLVGSELPERAIDPGPVRTQDSGAVPRAPELTTTDPQRGKTARKPRRKKKRRLSSSLATPAGPAGPAGAMPPEQIDWGALVPRIIGTEVGPLAGVVPAAHVSGEIVVAPSAAKPAQPDAQPSIVFDEAAERADAGARANVEAARASAAQADAERVTAERITAKRAAATAELAAAERAVAERAVAERAETERADAEARARVVHDSLTVDSGAPTARTIAPPVAEVTEAAPAPVGDEPSDGVVRHRITTAKAAPAKRRRVPTKPPEDDRPEDAVGEITTPARATREPRMSEPSILVPDLAVIHAEVSVIASEQITTPIAADAASPALAAEVASVRSDAAAFSEVEEAFFRAGHEKDAAHVKAPPIAESFADLDEDYQPVGFWDRLRGKAPLAPDRPTTAPPVEPELDKPELVEPTLDKK